MLRPIVHISPMKQSGWRERLAEVVEKDGRAETNISKAAGLSPSYLNGVLFYGKDASFERLIKIAEVLNVSVSYLAYGVEVSRDQEQLLKNFSQLTEEQQEAVLTLTQSFAVRES